MTFDNDHQRTARLRMDNALAALDIHRKTMQSDANGNDAMLNKLKEEVRLATKEFLSSMER